MKKFILFSALFAAVAAILFFWRYSDCSVQDPKEE